MGHLRVLALLSPLLVVLPGTEAFAQATTAPVQHRPLPASVSAGLEQVQRWFELDAPFSRRLKLSFDTRPLPTYETLRLPTFEGRATLWQQGSLSLSLIERVAPALELDCGATCKPILEQSIVLDARANLGRVNRQIPSTYLFFRPQWVRVGPGHLHKTLLGFGGLLDL